VQAQRGGSRAAPSGVAVAIAAGAAVVCAVGLPSARTHEQRPQLPRRTRVDFSPLRAPNGHSVVLNPGHGGIATAVSAYFGVHKPPRASVPDPLHGKPPRALIGRIPTTFPTRKRLIALTFDAGANDAGVPRIFATLKRLRVPATFFMTGHFARLFPGWARRIGAAYDVGNHTMNHHDLNTLSDAQVCAEILDAQRTIGRITGRRPQPLFRFPYGDESRRTLRIVNSLGYAAVGWTADTAGWLGPSGGQSTRTVIGRALAALRPGAILLMHVGSNPNDGSTLDAYALPTIVRAIERRGYAFTALPQAYALAYPSWAAAGHDGQRQPRRAAREVGTARSMSR